MSDYRIWKNDIINRWSPTAIDENTEGDGFKVYAAINEVTYGSSWKMSLWDCYKDLRQQLLGGDETILPALTTAQRDTLNGIHIGFPILNLDTGQIEAKTATSWGTGTQ